MPASSIPLWKTNLLERRRQKKEQIPAWKKSLLQRIQSRQKTFLSQFASNEDSVSCVLTEHLPKVSDNIFVKMENHLNPSLPRYPTNLPIAARTNDLPSPVEVNRMKERLAAGSRNYSSTPANDAAMSSSNLNLSSTVDISMRELRLEDSKDRNSDSPTGSPPVPSPRTRQPRADRLASVDVIAPKGFSKVTSFSAEPFHKAASHHVIKKFSAPSRTAKKQPHANANNVKTCPVVRPRSPSLTAVVVANRPVAKRRQSSLSTVDGSEPANADQEKSLPDPLSSSNTKKDSTEKPDQVYNEVKTQLQQKSCLANQDSTSKLLAEEEVFGHQQLIEPVSDVVQPEEDKVMETCASSAEEVSGEKQSVTVVGSEELMSPLVEASSDHLKLVGSNLNGSTKEKLKFKPPLPARKVIPPPPKPVLNGTNRNDELNKNTTERDRQKDNETVEPCDVNLRPKEKNHNFSLPLKHIQGVGNTDTQQSQNILPEVTAVKEVKAAEITQNNTKPTSLVQAKEDLSNIPTPLVQAKEDQSNIPTRSRLGGPGVVSANHFGGKTFTIDPSKFKRTAPIQGSDSKPTSGLANGDEIVDGSNGASPATQGKRKLRADQITVIGGYVKLDHSTLANPNRMKRAVRVKFVEKLLESVHEYPSENFLLNDMEKHTTLTHTLPSRRDSQFDKFNPKYLLALDEKDILQIDNDEEIRSAGMNR